MAELAPRAKSAYPQTPTPPDLVSNPVWLRQIHFLKLLEEQDYGIHFWNAGERPVRRNTWITDFNWFLDKTQLVGQASNDAIAPSRMAFCCKQLNGDSLWLCFKEP
jgi:hypothetical protein